MPAESEHEFLEGLLQSMIEQDIDVTFRKVALHSGGRFAHASTFTRRLDLRTAILAAERRQQAVRQIAAKFSKNSPSLLAERLAAAQVEIGELKRQRDLLVAGHRAAILAIGRIGGMKAWREYFADYSDALQSLSDLDALPEAEIVHIGGGPSRPRGGQTSGDES